MSAPETNAEADEADGFWLDMGSAPVDGSPIDILCREYSTVDLSSGYVHRGTYFKTFFNARWKHDRVDPDRLVRAGWWVDANGERFEGWSPQGWMRPQRSESAS